MLVHSEDSREELEKELTALEIHMEDRGIQLDDLQDIIGTQRDVIATFQRKGRLRRIQGQFTCTAYEAGPRSCGKWADGMTATGIPVGLGIAAADPRILPYGTVLYIQELDRYHIVMDCGGAIKGRRLDLYTNSVADALQLGRFTATVYILGG